MSIKELSGKVFLVVTGASRGIGKQLAISIGSVLEKGSHVLLLATNLNALKETAKNIPASVSVDTVSADLAKTTKDKLHGKYIYYVYFVHRINYTHIYKYIYIFFRYHNAIFKRSSFTSV